jgi:hypothetical protein
MFPLLTRSDRMSKIRLLHDEGAAAVRRYAFLFLLVFSLSILPFAEEEDFLRVEASVSPESLSGGGEGKVILKIKIDEGMRVNPNPSFSIEFAPCEALVFGKEVYTPADLGIEISEEMGEEYLKLDEAVEISFTVNSDAKSGEYLLKGEVKYFLCSKEGWCLKSSSQFSAPFKIEAYFDSQPVVLKIPVDSLLDASLQGVLRAEG